MLILLDIDGVMTSANSWKRPELLSDGFALFNPKATDALNKIILKTNADILLTTSHKASYTPKKWATIFQSRGIQVDSIQSLPDNVSRLSRKQEILNWIINNPQEDAFIIIDDDKTLNDLPTIFKDKWILTRGSIGLTDELAEKAITLLKKNKSSTKKSKVVTKSKKTAA